MFWKEDLQTYPPIDMEWDLPTSIVFQDVCLEFLYIENKLPSSKLT